MYRLEDQGLTLRLFRNVREAKNHPDAFAVAGYGAGAIATDRHGRWIDAHGVLPSAWVPNTELLAVLAQHGYYVDVNGKACCADLAPNGCHFSFRDEKTYREIWIVKDEDGEVCEQYVLWPTIAAMVEAGVDVTYERPSDD